MKEQISKEAEFQICGRRNSRKNSERDDELSRECGLDVVALPIFHHPFAKWTRKRFRGLDLSFRKSLGMGQPHRKITSFLQTPPAN